jgi:hypothetical protein
MTIRYGLYLAPPALSDLWAFGCGVLGYDAERGADVPQIVPPSQDPASFHVLTEDPRRYGFHATMKAPFRLAEGRTVEELQAALADFCADRTAFRLPRLEVKAVGANAAGDAFIALVEPAPTPELIALERDLVLGFEPFRAPLTDAEIARRNPDRLTERQRENLMTYGYPGVLDLFRFHLTLTGRAPAADVPRLEAELAALYAERVPEPGMLVDQVALFEQIDGGRFTVRERVLFV